MSVTSALVVYAVLWFLIMLMILPIGMRSQQDVGRVEPGTPASAPDNPMILRKMLWATGLAFVGFLIVYGVIEGRVITREDISGFAPFDQ
jgi:predicted secreted protein